MKRALVSAAITAAAVSFTATPAFASTTHPSRPTTYTVKWGDTVWSIGKRFGVNMIALAEYNGRYLDQTLYAGSTLRIPPAGWQPTAAAPVQTTAATTSSESDTSATSTYTAPATPSYSNYTPSGVWACIAQHESSGNPATDTGNGYYGLYQFTLSTWYAAGGTGNPADASAAVQTAVAQRVQQQQGWGAWPVSSAACGV
jgi:LysM repeat protein